MDNWQLAQFSRLNISWQNVVSFETVRLIAESCCQKISWQLVAVYETISWLMWLIIQTSQEEINQANYLLGVPEPVGVEHGPTLQDGPWTSLGVKETNLTFLLFFFKYLQDSERMMHPVTNQMWATCGTASSQRRECVGYSLATQKIWATCGTVR